MQDQASDSKNFWNKVWRGEVEGNSYSNYVGYLFDDRRLTGKRVLDVGCGPAGDLVRICRDSGDTSYVGLDISEEAILQARKRFPEKSFIIGDAVKLPFKDNTFELVFSLDTLPILGADARRAMRELVRVSSDTIVFALALDPDPVGETITYPDGLRTVTFSRPEIDKMLANLKINVENEDLDLGRLYIEASKR